MELGDIVYTVEYTGRNKEKRNWVFLFEFYQENEKYAYVMPIKRTRLGKTTGINKNINSYVFIPEILSHSKELLYAKIDGTTSEKIGLLKPYGQSLSRQTMMSILDRLKSSCKKIDIEILKRAKELLGQGNCQKKLSGKTNIKISNK